MVALAGFCLGMLTRVAVDTLAEYDREYDQKQLQYDLDKCLEECHRNLSSDLHAISLSAESIVELDQGYFDAFAAFEACIDECGTEEEENGIHNSWISCQRQNF
jgi:hypothetical protein